MGIVNNSTQNQKPYQKHFILQSFFKSISRKIKADSKILNMYSLTTNSSLEFAHALNAINSDLTRGKQQKTGICKPLFWQDSLVVVFSTIVEFGVFLSLKMPKHFIVHGDFHFHSNHIENTSRSRITIISFSFVNVN